MTAQPLPPGRIRAAFAPITRPAYCTCDSGTVPHVHHIQVATYDATVIDRTDATDAEFEARLERLDRLEVADVAADTALQRVLDLADELELELSGIAADLLTDHGVRLRWNAVDRIRAAVAGPPPDGGDVR